MGKEILTGGTVKKYNFSLISHLTICELFVVERKVQRSGLENSYYDYFDQKNYHSN